MPIETIQKCLRAKRALFVLAAALSAIPVLAQPPIAVTYSPYLQLGDNGPFGTTDQIVVAWQTNEAAPNVAAYQVVFGLSNAYGTSATLAARVVDNYLAADPSLPAVAGSYGAHSNHTAVLSGLSFDTTYFYKVTGPGLPGAGFTSSFHTRKQSPVFSFAVEGDEGYFPAAPNTNPATIVNYEARIAHLINNAGSISLPGSPARPAPEFVLNTGDNIYTNGSEDNYRDFFFPVLNNDVDSNETGAPILRHELYFVVPGNHDLGSTGVSVNMLADNSAPLFSGNTSGGDALGYYNNLYYPLNGPVGYDIQNEWTSDASVANGMTFSYQNQTYNSPAAISAFRASTNVNTGSGPKRQVDHMTNYSFDYGNAHFLYLDANPHLFNDILPGGSAYTTPPPPAFTAYPTGLRDWVVNDLDSSKQLWKVVVFHQPAFSSGDATVLNNQMRAVAKLLEDHGVNMVFNGHEHNYQRTLPLRATAHTAGTPTTTAGSPAVFVDNTFDGISQTVPDGVLYMVEGAGGNRDFDGNQAAPRGSGLGVDQDDSATGTATPVPGLTVPQGPSDWLDTNLTNREMVTNFANAGTGTKITSKFKSKIFSFGHVLVNNNSLTLYQITEPLQATSSATASNPAPYGTDYQGKPLNDPIPDTVLNAADGTLLSTPATGTPALLDQWTVTKPDLSSSFAVTITAPPSALAGGPIVYTIQATNHSTTPLNGTQFRLTLPSSVSLASATSDVLSVQGSDVVATLGRLAPGSTSYVQISTRAAATASVGSTIAVSGTLTSGTALPVAAPSVSTKIVNVPGLPVLPALQ